MSVIFRHLLLITNVAHSTSSLEYSSNDSPIKGLLFSGLCYW